MKKNNIFELAAIYDARQSFYGKAKVIEDGEKTILRSYDTAVAMIDGNGELKIRGKYSQTTTRHVKEFAKQYGFNVDKGIDKYFVSDAKTERIFEKYDA